MDKKLLDVLMENRDGTLTRLYDLLDHKGKAYFERNLADKENFSGFSPRKKQEFIIEQNLCRQIPEGKILEAIEIIRPLYKEREWIVATSASKSPDPEYRNLRIWSNVPCVWYARADWTANSEYGIFETDTNSKFIDGLVKQGILKQVQDTFIVTFTEFPGTRCATYHIPLKKS